MDIRLTPDQKQLFKNALLDAFTPGELEQVVSLGLKEEYAKIVPDANYDRQVFELVEYVNRRNLVEQLLDAALTANPGNTKLKEFASTIKGPVAVNQPSPDPNVPQMVDMLRKNRQDIEHLRKRGQLDRAEYIFDTTNARYQSHSSLSRPSREEEEEYALLRLEHLYLELGEWSRAQVRAEDLIKRFDQNMLQDGTPVLAYVVGCAYNVLGISLHMEGGSSKLAKSARDAWNTATDTLHNLDVLDVEKVRTQIKINYASMDHEEGNCDDAIDRLERLMTDVRWDDVPTKQKVEIEYNLAEAYLDRRYPADIVRADSSADLQLQRAISADDLEEWGYALILKLDALCARIPMASRADKKKLVQQAQTLYEGYNAAQRSQGNKEDWEVSNARRTLQRSLVQLLALAGDIEGAQSVLTELEDPSTPKPEDFREIADMAMTRAVVRKQQGYWELALHELEEARRYFGHARHTGRAVDSLLEMARLNFDHGKSGVARKELLEAQELARNLGCKSREARINKLLKQVGG